MRECRPGERGLPRFVARALACCLLAVAAASTATAQRAAAPSDAATVFVSRLKAEAVDYQVKLTWTDSPDVTGSCVVYRSTEEITPQTLGRATVAGSVATGAGSFIDTPPGRGGWFYAVLIRSSSGTLYTPLIQFRNKTSSPVSPLTAAPEEQLAARISAIRAAPSAQGDSIEVTFSVSSPSRDLLLFWGPSPFAKAEDLLRATKATPLDAGATRYVLPVLPGIDYWFAVLDAGMFKLGKAPLEKGVNTTAYAVQLPVTSSHGLPAPAAVSSRGIPLPSLAITRGVQTGQSLDGGDLPALPEPRPISGATQKALDALKPQLPAPPAVSMRPEVLPSDSTPTPAGERAQLQDVIQGPFLSGDMSATESRLLAFLSLPRTAELAARARFYLGQVYYFEGRSRDALLEFLSAQDSYYQETSPWIDACFEKLEKEDL